MVLLLLVGCGSSPFRAKVQDERLKVWIQSFEYDYDLTIGYSVIIEPLENNWVGVCRKDKYGIRTVSVDAEFYERNKDSYWVMHQLMYHEFGHCTFNKDHNDSYRNDGMPASIMRSYVFATYAPTYYENNIEYYLDELPVSESTEHLNEMEKLIGCPK